MAMDHPESSSTKANRQASPSANLVKGHKCEGGQRVLWQIQTIIGRKGGGGGEGGFSPSRDLGVDTVGRKKQRGGDFFSRMTELQPKKFSSPTP